MGLDFDSFVLAASTADLAEAAAAREFADGIEFRMDLADEPLRAIERYVSDAELDADAGGDGGWSAGGAGGDNGKKSDSDADEPGTGASPLPILATNRAEWEGGEADDDGRLEELAEAARFDIVEAVDVELASLRAGEATDVLETARAHDVAIVASAHDFDGTPPAVEMTATLAEACEYADVGKLAVTADDHEDALALLTVTHRLAADGKTVATMAMGDAGSHTRVVAPVYGSRIGYAPVDPAKATAPGQYDLETLSSLVARLQDGTDVTGTVP